MWDTMTFLGVILFVLVLFLINPNKQGRGG